MRRYIFNIVSVALALVALSACSNDSDGGGTGGTPEVRYVRPCDADASDSLLTSGYLGNQIVLIGEHLAGVNQIYFNDQKAKLNPNFITDNAIIVTIPQGIPGEKQDLIKLYTTNDSCYYTFETKVPAPTVNSMTCEYVLAGDIAYIQGLYFVDDEGTPLKVTFSNGAEAEIVTQDLNNLAVKVPAGAQSGPVTVTSVYGATESSFWFRDNRNIILDFNSDNYPDYGYYFGWTGGAGVGTDGAINGNYLILGDGAALDDETWNDGKFGYQRWSYRQTDPDFFNAGALDKYVLKFEVNVQGWSSSALQVIFTGAEEVWMNWQEDSSGGNPNNAYMSDKTYPRALWIPWSATGSFSTDGWITVTIPLTDFKYNNEGADVGMKAAGHYSGITLFVNGGGVKGTPCTPTFHIDNVRVVSAQ
ncbi:MAG: glycan-binding surface protein [Candidatus Symbiothrix sp.]|jgi:hypothetical protein|nr:glycan-binding surface protein [Candidatus Symbiothrix sp.]